MVYHEWCKGVAAIAGPILTVESPPTVTLSPGARLGLYEVIAPIGAGGALPSSARVEWPTERS